LNREQHEAREFLEMREKSDWRASSEAEDRAESNHSHPAA
jgi:hypothetical protein